MKTIITMATLAVFAGLADVQAQPVLSSNCPVAKRIRMPLGGSGFHMSADCRTVYVLPPETGGIKLTSFSESASLQRCKELDGVLKNLREINTRLTAATSVKAESPQRPSGFDPYGPLVTYPNSTGNDREEVKLTEEEMISLLQRKKDITDSLLKEYGSTPAIKVGLLYSTGYADYLEKVRGRNRHLDLNFEIVPLKKTRLIFNTTKKGEADFPIALKADFPTSDEHETVNQSVTGEVELSLFGACALRSPFSGKIPSYLNSRSFAAHLPAKLSYEYDLMTTVKYKATYSKGGLAEKVRESSTKGGFFSSKTVSKLSSTTRTDSWFEYSYSCDEARACEEAHDVNILELKGRLIDEVISNIALVKFEYPLAPESAATPGTNGAGTASGELKKCHHKYCMIAAGVLDVANATLGQTSKVDSYINNERHWSIEEVTTSKAYPYQGSMGFAPKDI